MTSYALIPPSLDIFLWAVGQPIAAHGPQEELFKSGKLIILQVCQRCIWCCAKSSLVYGLP